MKYLIFLGCLIIGFILIRYSKWVVDSTGIRFSFIEENIPGGTYTFWKLLGLLLIAFGFYQLFAYVGY